MKTRVGNPVRKLVLIKLADNANDDGQCWPSYQHIADQCEISRSTVKAHVRALEEMGLLRRQFRRDEGAKTSQSNVYHLTLGGQPVIPAGGQNLPEGGADFDPGVGQDMTGGGAGAAPGGGAVSAPRTSHSFEPVNEPGKRRQKTGNVPVQKIVDLFNQMLTPALPQVVILNEQRKAKIRQRWNENEAHQCGDYWREFFSVVSQSDFLMGRLEGKNGAKPFRATFDWLFSPTNFAKVVEGNYSA